MPDGIETASLDPGVKPCDDFFQYACGGWIKANPIPEDQASWGRFNALGEQNEVALRTILERDMTAPDPSEARAASLGDFYASCMDEKAVEKDDLHPLAAALARADAIKDPDSLARATAQLQLAESRAFFQLAAEQDPKDATRMIALVDQRGLALPDRDYYLLDEPRMSEMRAKYQAHVARMLALAGDGADDAKAGAEGVMRIERALAEASMTREDHRDPAKIYHPVDRAGLAKLAPHFAWDAYLKELGFPGLSAFDVNVPGFLAAVDKLAVASGTATGRRDLRAYVRVHLLEHDAAFLSARFVDESFRFEKDLFGTTRNRPRWKRCVAAIDQGMGMALAQPFVKATLGAEGRAETQAMVRAIEQSMKDEITRLSWMDDATRAAALEKLAKITNMIGYPDAWRSYDGLVVDRASFGGNVLRAAAFEKRRDLSKIGKPVDRADWGETPPTVDAYYDPSLNQMVFPAGILQPPFFSRKAPSGVSLGGVGMAMGHELTHGFDDQGRRFDGDGNLRDWWTAKVNAEFEARAACVAKQFDAYVVVDDLHENGRLTLGENIADLGGLKLAHAAFVRTRGQAEDAAAADRRFFIGFAQTWCSSERDELKRVLAYDEHSLPRFRVNGPVSNTPAFARAFACGPTSAMVRREADRCELW